MEDATRQAQMIVENATAEANDIKASAIQYTDESLGNIQNILNTAIEGMTVKYDGVMRSLESSLDVATKDRQALRDYYAQERNTPAPEESYSDDSFNMMPEDAGQPASGYVESTYDPVQQPQDQPYDDHMTIADALGEEEPAEEIPEEIPDVSDYGSVDEIKDFDLAFDDFK